MPAGALAANLSFAFMTLGWGSLYPILSLQLQTWDALSASAARAGIASLILCSAVRLMRGPVLLTGGLPVGRLLLLGGVGITASFALASVGTLYANPVSAAITATTMPIVAAVVGRCVYRIPIGRGVAIGAFFATAGGICVAYAGGGTLGHARGGEILILISNACWAWFSITAPRWLVGWHPLRISALTLGSGALMLVLLIPVADGLGLIQARASLAVDPLLLTLGLGLMVGIANPLWHFGVSRLGVTVGAMFGNFSPVVAVLIAAALGQEPTFLHLAGGGLVIVGVALAQLWPFLWARFGARGDTP